MAERSDIVTVTLTQYDETGWPLIKILGKWVRSPIGIRKLGQGRYAVDTVKGIAVILEFWWIRNRNG